MQAYPWWTVAAMCSACLFRYQNVIPFPELAVSSVCQWRTDASGVMPGLPEEEMDADTRVRLTQRRQRRPEAHFQCLLLERRRRAGQQQD